MRNRTCGYAVSAVFVLLAIDCTTILHARPSELAKAAYTGVANHGSSNAYLPMVFRRSSGWNSYIAVQNLGTAQADVLVNFYTNSSTPVHVENIQVPVGASGVISTSGLIGIPVGFMGSAEVQATQPIAVGIVNVNEESVTASNGFHEGSSTLYLWPVYYAGGSGVGRASTTAIQNTGNSSVTVNISYTDGTSANFVVGPKQSHFIDEETRSHTAPVMSAVVSADGPIAVAGRVRDLVWPDTYDFEGQPAIITYSVAPVTFLENQDRISFPFIFNVGSTTATVNSRFEGFSIRQQDAAPLETFLAIDPNLPVGYRGSFSVDSNRPVILGVEERDFSTDGDQSSYYVGSDIVNLDSRSYNFFAAKNWERIVSKLDGPERLNSWHYISNSGTSKTEFTLTLADFATSTQAPDSKTPGPHVFGLFPLEPGESIEIDLSSIPSVDLPDGGYAVTIESDGEPLASAVRLNVEFMPPIIFSDGFESGNTSSWSSSVP